MVSDGKSLITSECLGTPANIVRQRLESNSKPERLTDHKADAVRLARISRDGNWIVYECGADLWMVQAAGGTPRKLAIEVHADDKDNGEQALTLSQGVSEYAMSADERSVAFTIMGELFIAPTSGGKANRLTDRAANDHAPVWSPDGKKLVLSSDVGGYEDLYLGWNPTIEYPASRLTIQATAVNHRSKRKSGPAPMGRRSPFCVVGS